MIIKKIVKEDLARMLLKLERVEESISILDGHDNIAKRIEEYDNKMMNLGKYKTK